MTGCWWRAGVSLPRADRENHDGPAGGGGRMDAILIRGGRPLAGELQVSGAKNAALPLLFASLLTPEACRIENVPRVVDCRTTQRLLAQLGVEVDSDDNLV